MSALRVTRNRRAIADLKEITDYIARDNVNAALRLADEFEDTIRLLAHTPFMGRERPELLPDLRSYPVGNYLLFYRVKPDRIQLVQVLHGARDLRSIFKQP